MGEAKGYANKWLDIDLGQKKISEFNFDEPTLRMYLGGIGLGLKLLYERVEPDTEWSDPKNCIVFSSGPLGGTSAKGSGTICLATKGALTGGATSSQANGHFGAFLKFTGFDGVIVSGRADNLSYIYISDGKVEIRDARHLKGKDTRETERLIQEELGIPRHGISVYGIGPAGENQVRFAGVFGDNGHVAGHNGPGAVMGSKNLKAIAVARGKGNVKVHDREKLSKLSNEMFETIKNHPSWSLTYKWGMLWCMTFIKQWGVIPVKNYSTNVWDVTDDELNTFSVDYLRKSWKRTPNPCWGCAMTHCADITITEGQYKGYEGEEPEYEVLAACGPVIGVNDGLSASYLANEVDKFGLEGNELGWVIGLVMECYEKGLLTKKDTDGLEMTWGNVEAVHEMMKRIAHRQGFGDVLAEGAMRAAQRIGGDAPNFAIHTMKGTTPCTHDHRLMWNQLFDTSVSNTGTVEADAFIGPSSIGLPELSNPFAYNEIASLIARVQPEWHVLDSLGVCKFTFQPVPSLWEGMINAATGWDVTWDELMQAGARTANLLRAFNVRCGLTSDKDYPSPRYGSAPPDGMAQGQSIMPVWEEMLDIYYHEIGADKTTGKPLPETLEKLGLTFVVPHLWP
ncbi:aldehyde ferredoxin oxidoreductase family protein [Chloroflexota bacterium]